MLSGIYFGQSIYLVLYVYDLISLLIVCGFASTERSFITCTTAEIRSHGTEARLGRTLHLLILSSGFLVLYLIG